MNELALIPKTDWDEYGALAPLVKQKFRQRAKAIHELDEAKKPGDVATDWAHKLKLGSGKAVFSLRSLFRAEGWRALVDKRAAGPSALNGKAWTRKDEGEMNLPSAAVEYLKKLFGDYKRKSRPAARAFVRQWERWRGGNQAARIPGFEQCPEPGPWGHPVGWSTRNLMRYLPSKLELDMERRGQGYAVGKRGPQIFTTRAKLWYMSHVMLDDVWHDNFVAFARQLVRTLELDVLDAFSGSLVAWGTKPRVRREDGTQDTTIKQYVPLILAATFSSEGYSPRGTEVMVEHGAAAEDDWVAELLFNASGGLITRRESGITGEEQAIIGWRGKGKGNSRFKGLLETHHSLKHNELAMLPSQTGLSRDTRPEFTHGMLEDDDDLIKAAIVLAKKDPARAAQLRLRSLDYHSAFLPLLTEIYRIITEREWHELEGWDKITGNVVMEYRLSPTTEAWLTDEDFQKLPAMSQQVVLAAANEDKRYLRRRRISPGAVQRRERGGLLKLPDWAIAELIAPKLEPPFAEERTVAGSYFNLIRDEEINGTDPMRFESRITTLDGRQEQLPDGTYLCVLNPFKPSCLYVFDAGKRYLGMAERDYAINRTEDELRDAYGRRAKRLNELTAPLIKRHAEDIKEETRRLKENADVLKEPEASPEAKRIERQAKREFGSQQEALNQL
jgi:hypothetical protein